MLPLQIAVIVVVLILSGCTSSMVMKKFFMSSTNIVKKQDEVREKIVRGDDIDIYKEIDVLENQVLVDSSFWGLNPIYTNNIAIRNNLLLAVLYNMYGDAKNRKMNYDQAVKYIDYNLINGSVWSEGPSYYLYTEQMIDLYIDQVEKDNYLLNVKNFCRSWIKKYITPDNLLPPIGDTRREKWEDSKYVADKMLYCDSEETLFKTDSLYLLVRHPSCIYKYIKNGHIHYDVGDIVVYYGGKCVIFPVGYNGYDNKKKYKLDDLRNKNSIFFKNLKEPLWRLGYYRLNDINRTDNNIKITYIINNKEVVRFINIEKNKIRITDVGSDGINLNMDIHKCSVVVKDGKKMDLKKGFHVDETNTVVENDRVFIPCESGTTSIEISFK